MKLKLCHFNWAELPQVNFHCFLTDARLSSPIFPYLRQSEVEKEYDGTSFYGKQSVNWTLPGKANWTEQKIVTVEMTKVSIP